MGQLIIYAGRCPNRRWPRRHRFTQIPREVAARLRKCGLDGPPNWYAGRLTGGDGCWDCAAAAESAPSTGKDQHD